MRFSLFRLITHHRSAVYYDSFHGDIRHGDPDSAPKNVALQVRGQYARFCVLGVHKAEFAVMEPGEDGSPWQIKLDEFSPIIAIDEVAEGSVSLSFREKFLSATEDGSLRFARPWCREWELFTLARVPTTVLFNSPRYVFDAANKICEPDFTGAGQDRPQGAGRGRTVSEGNTFAVVGPFNTSLSLSAANRRLASLLETKYPNRVHVYQNDKRLMLDVPKHEAQPLERIQSRRWPARGCDVVIHQSWPVNAPSPKGGVTLAYFFWEETRVLQSCIDLLNLYDAVLIPAEFIGPALLASGLKRPIFDVGFSPNLTPFISAFERRSCRRRDDDRFTFLHISSAAPRKGVDVLLEAYAKAFDPTDEVRLILKCPRYFAIPYILAAKKKYPNLGEIVLIDDELDIENLVALYESADVMVLPTRGEGFNIPAAEAIAAGVPLIVTGFSGHMRFCGNGIARQLRYELTPSRSEFQIDGSFWANPDVEDLCSAMREAKQGALTQRLDLRDEILRSLDPEIWINNVTQASETCLSTRSRWL